MPTQTLSTVNKKTNNIPQDNFASTAIAQSQQTQLNVIPFLKNNTTEPNFRCWVRSAWSPTYKLSYCCMTF
jgi:hypothetical protein